MFAEMDMGTSGYDPVFGFPEQGGERDGEDESAPELALPDLGAICRGMPGKHKRIMTHCRPLDVATGGGFQTGRLVVLGGPPGVTKTGFALAMAYDMARYGTVTSTGHAAVHVHIIAADEPRDGLLSRLGQMDGLKRADLESEDLTIASAAWEHVARQLGECVDLTIWDPRHESITVESVALYAHARALREGARLVIIIDSVQTAPCSCDAPGETERERLEKRMRALRTLTVKQHACVIAISELNRGGYGQGASADLASFKGAGGIEYGADVAIAMARVKDDHAFIVEVSLLKSRLGDEPTFRLRRTERCQFEPIEAASEPVEAADVDNIADARIAKLEAAIVLALVRTKADVCSRGDLLELVPGRRQDMQRAISRLLNSGRIERVGRVFKVRSEGST